MTPLQIKQVAAEIAARIPAMAQDCATNNAVVIEGLIAGDKLQESDWQRIPVQIRAHVDWIRSQLDAIGINVRQSGQRVQMQCYLVLLSEEMDMTVRFLK